MKLKRLSIDIETYSDVDLKNKGVYLYVNSPNFDILIITFKFEGSDNITTIDTTKLNDKAEREKLKFLKCCLMNNAIIKVAYNATFERVCFSKYFGIDYDPKYWRCTMVLGAMAGLPMGLGQVARILNTETKKDGKGMQLIRTFSIPDKNGNRLYPTTKELIRDWNDYKLYNRDDVLAEMDVCQALDYVKIPKFEQAIYELDAKINDRGVKINIPLVEKIKDIMEIENKQNFKKSFLLSGIINPKSPKQVKQYLEEELGETLEKTDKAALNELLERPFLPDHIREFIFIKLAMSKSSLAKFDKMLMMANPKDKRARGLFQLYGAMRTGRWAGRAIQLQNLPRISIKGKLSTFIDFMLKNGPNESIDLINLWHGNVSYFCSQMIRPSFIPEKGSQFVIADFAGIENRVLAFLAKENWKLQAFKDDRDVYIETAIKMFHLDPEKNYKGTPERQKGKVCELGLGYQGAEGALIRTGVFSSLVKELKARGFYGDLETEAMKELTSLVKAWRGVNPNIKKFWYAVQKAAIKAAKGCPNILNGIKFLKRNDCLVIVLLSGRELIYQRIKVVQGQYGEALTYWGLDGVSKQWTKRDTYGGSLVENIVQATARDILAFTMLRLDKLGYNIVMHVHDEVVIECLENESEEVLSKTLEIMALPIDWIKGVPLKGEGKISDFYTK